MKIYKSKDILSMEDLYGLQDSFGGSCIAFKYKMSEGELNWYNYVKNKYSIADWIGSNLKGATLTFNCPFELGEALNSDGISHKAVMLSDDTALQRLFFWLSLNE